MADARLYALPEGPVAAHHHRGFGQAQPEHQHCSHQVQRHQDHVGAGEPVKGDEQAAGYGPQDFSNVVGDGLQGHGVSDAVLPRQVEQAPPAGWDRPAPWPSPAAGWQRRQTRDESGPGATGSAGPRPPAGRRCGCPSGCATGPGGRPASPPPGTGADGARSGKRRSAPPGRPNR